MTYLLVKTTLEMLRNGALYWLKLPIPNYLSVGLYVSLEPFCSTHTHTTSNSILFVFSPGGADVPTVYSR